MTDVIIDHTVLSPICGLGDCTNAVSNCSGCIEDRAKREFNCYLKFHRKFGTWHTKQEYPANVNHESYLAMLLKL